MYLLRNINNIVLSIIKYTKICNEIIIISSQRYHKYFIYKEQNVRLRICFKNFWLPNNIYTSLYNTETNIFVEIVECCTNKPCRVFHISPVPPGRRAGAFLGQSPGPMGPRDSPFDPRPSPSPAPYLSRATAPRTSSLARRALLVVHPSSLQLPVQDLPVSVSCPILQLTIIL